METWLHERNARLYPESAGVDQFKILGYQWRVMRFNDHTRQSTVKVMTCYRTSGQRSLFLMQQPHVLAVPCEFTCIILHWPWYVHCAQSVNIICSFMSVNLQLALAVECSMQKLPSLFFFMFVLYLSSESRVLQMSRVWCQQDWRHFLVLLMISPKQYPDRTIWKFCASAMVVATYHCFWQASSEVSTITSFSNS